jgi:hypothetical protein
MSPPTIQTHSVRLNPTLPMLIDPPDMDESFRILNEAYEKAKAAVATGSGNSNANNNSTHPAPVEALEKLQVMLSKGLISQAEHDAKRQDILNAM